MDTNREIGPANPQATARISIEAFPVRVSNRVLAVLGLLVALAPRRRGETAVGVIAVLGVLVVLAVVLFLGIRSCENTATKISDTLAGGFKPNVEVATTIASTIRDLQIKPKLVVLTVVGSVTIEKSVTTRVLWGLIYLGTTTVKVEALDNMVQYFVPADQIMANGRATYNKSTRTLHFCLPVPQLDKDMVSVQSDPRKIKILTNGAWLSLDKYEGKFVRDEARKDLLPAVISMGQEKSVQQTAREQTQIVVGELLAKGLADKLLPGVKVQVDFDEPKP